MRLVVRLLFAAFFIAVFPVSAAPLGDTAKAAVTRELVSLYAVPLMARAQLTERIMDWKSEPLFEVLTERKSHLKKRTSKQATELRCILLNQPHGAHHRKLDSRLLIVNDSRRAAHDVLSGPIRARPCGIVDTAICKERAQDRREVVSVHLWV